MITSRWAVCSTLFICLVTSVRAAESVDQDPAADNAGQELASDDGVAGSSWADTLAAGRRTLDRVTGWREGKRLLAKPAAAAKQALDQPAELIPSNPIYIRVSKSFLEKHLCKAYDKTSPVRDTILGAAVSGVSRTVAQPELELVDNPADAEVILRFEGDTYFETTSVSGPVQIHSRGTTRFASKKTLQFDGLDLRQGDPLTTAKTETQTLGISTRLPGLRGIIARQIATRREADTHDEAERITSEHTKQRIERAFSQAIDARAVALTKQIKEQYAKLPLKGTLAVNEIKCSTTPDSLQIAVLGKIDRASLVAAEPARLPHRPEIEVHIHSSLVKHAICNPELRALVQSSLAGVVDGPLEFISFGGASSGGEGDRELKIAWTQASDTQWLTLTWQAKERPVLQAMKAASAE